ncbi:conserved membrane hypothetical protein [Roseovarius sp. EC-HK134]|uniref:hypothetical protein n=1 Tax=unclassified Roseovarius TaxID=2614913 RepID=UPI001250FD67|nr:MULTISPECIES: hypothetical protein [unclassified Roseovarius]VVS97767.1 conserved membrane hypothetical protein [Roseovarius sp. EC-HK134]VVS99111.1 conserved membrane hypothetical protein [Roseovarius sp. EC-SD190]
MRSAAMVLGVIGGCLAVLVGFFSYGYTEVVNRIGEVDGLLTQVSDPALIRSASFLAPLLAIAGGAMAKVRALWGGLLLLVSAGLMHYAFGFNVFTMFPLGFTALAGVLAIAAGKPDEPKAHF